MRLITCWEWPACVVCETRAGPESGQDVVSVTDSDTAPPDLPNAGRVAVLASRVPVVLVAVVSGVAIGVFVVLGILQRVAFPDWSAANLDSEVSIATWFSATLLWVAAFWWLLVAVTGRPWSLAVWVWWPVLAWLALDEGSAMHERLERWSGIDWQLLYVPLMGVAAAALWGVFRRYRSQARIAALLMTGAVAWIVVLTLELIQNWGGSPIQAAIYVPTMITEETLEMIGSTVLLVAAILILHRTIRAASESEE
jgi:hypothetical protein